jgi:hypothetical protein
MASVRQLKERKDKCVNFQLHPKKVHEEPEPQSEMTADEMTVAGKALDDAEKAIYEASKCLLNLSLAIKNPSDRQADILRERVRGLRGEVENMSSTFFR